VVQFEIHRAGGLNPPVGDDQTKRPIAWKCSVCETVFALDRVDAILVLVAVTDVNGAAVTGLGPVNFKGFTFVTNIPNGASPATPALFPNTAIPSPTEIGPGIYSLTIQASHSSVATRSDLPCVLQVSEIVQKGPGDISTAQMGAVVIRP
jgi:hypothetical protein